MYTVPVYLIFGTAITIFCIKSELATYGIKCKKHFIKMLKDVGMVVPKSKETRL